MEISFVGLGKLGLPVACLFASKGHIVHGYESNLIKLESYYQGKSNLYEPGIDELLQEVEKTTLILHSRFDNALRRSEIIFIAVPTPSLNNDAFDTSYVKDILINLQPFLQETQRSYPIIALISTVLPGTFDNEFKNLLPELGDRYGFCYNAQFIAMGSVIENMMNPEFVLIGEYDDVSGEVLEEFYYTLRLQNEAPIVRTSITNAEIIKCVYNNFISLKIVYANTIMEMCDKLGANCDEVSDALSLATDRLLSPKYLYGGLGDGGGCLVAGTKISLLNGTEVCIEDLVGKKEFWVYSYDLITNKVVPGRGHSARITQTKVQICKITLDNGESICCTLDHPFLMRNGDYKEAKDLVVKDSLMPLYRRSSDGYEYLDQPDGTRVLTHRMVYAAKYNTKSDAKIHAHHVDHNKRNNDPANIIMIDSGSHTSHHNNVPERLQQQSLLMSALNQTGKVNTVEHRQKTTERNLTNNPVNLPGVKEKISLSNIIIQQQKIQNGTHHLLTNNPTPKRMLEGVHNFIVDHPMKSLEKRKQVAKALRDRTAKKLGYISDEELTSKVQELRFQESKTVREITEITGLDHCGIYRRLALINHKIVSIEFVGYEDVYNFEVDIYENYAVSAGVFIHNCHPRDNRALSYLSRELGLSANPFEFVSDARIDQTRWLALRIATLQLQTSLSIKILGVTFKPKTNLTDDSPSFLLGKLLNNLGLSVEYYDPVIFPDCFDAKDSPKLYVIGTTWDSIKQYPFVEGSVIVDPWGFLDKAPEGCELIKVGRH